MVKRRTLLAFGAGWPERRARAQQHDVQRILGAELQRSRPDYVVYVPGHYDGSTHDRHNEHVLVFDGPGGSLERELPGAGALLALALPPELLEPARGVLVGAWTPFPKVGEVVA